jgi:post-segregation antitoxin (ccd killing protein)
VRSPLHDVEAVEQVAEEALAQQVARRKAEQLKAEIRRDLEAVNSYTAKYGSFAEMVRQHYHGDED